MTRVAVPVIVCCVGILLAFAYIPSLSEWIRPQDESVEAIFLFDGLCNLCNGLVNFIIEHDSAHRLKFASLQSAAGKQILMEHGIPEYSETLQSLVLVENKSTYYTHSTAALRIMALLDPPYPILYSFIVVPPIIRDAVYDVVSSWRYDIFGKEDTCRVPTADLKNRFLE